MLTGTVQQMFGLVHNLEYGNIGLFFRSFTGVVEITLKRSKTGLLGRTQQKANDFNKTFNAKTQKTLKI